MPVVMSKGITEGEAYCTTRPMVAYTPHPSSQENSTTAVVNGTETQQTEKGAEVQVYSYEGYDYSTQCMNWKM